MAATPHVTHDSAPGDPPVLPPATTSRPPRRTLRAVARWTVAVLVCAGLGVGGALGISGLDREDVPGLATKSDGRWAYPKLALPALSADEPRPFTDGNTAEIHYADLRKLLLPAPAGATADKKLTGGWVSTDQYVSEYVPDERAGLKQSLKDYAVRHIAARGWTMPDGTASRVYLLQFESAAFAESFNDSKIRPEIMAGTALATASQTTLDEGWDADGEVPGITSIAYLETLPYGATQTRQAYVTAGDVFALIVQEKKGGAPAVPFHQALILQNQLLG